MGSDSDWYGVVVEAVSADGEQLDPADDRVGELRSLALPHRGSVTAGGGLWSVRVCVQAADAPAAVRQGAKLVAELNRAASMPRWPAARVEASRVDLLDRELASPALSELVGPIEAAAMLGVSRQRVHQLATQHRRFPAPLLRLGSGPLWPADAISTFAATWERKPGRPRTAGSEDPGGGRPGTGSSGGQPRRVTDTPPASSGRPANDAKLRRHSAGRGAVPERVGGAAQ